MDFNLGEIYPRSADRAALAATDSKKIDFHFLAQAIERKRAQLRLLFRITSSLISEVARVS
jgi:hypothetical protein